MVKDSTFFMPEYDLDSSCLSLRSACFGSFEPPLARRLAISYTTMFTAKVKMCPSPLFSDDLFEPLFAASALRAFPAGDLGPFV